MLIFCLFVGKIVTSATCLSKFVKTSTGGLNFDLKSENLDVFINYKVKPVVGCQETYTRKCCSPPPAATL